MKLIECYIENFGKLSDFKHSFKDGLNTISWDNGAGKTTLTVFIKAMLYGLEATKRVKLENNERKRYTPWQMGRFGGSLTFENGGKTYRIERTFAQKASDDVFKLYDCGSGKESCDFTENVGEELFGIDADGFERTVFLSEENLSGKNDNKTVSAKLTELVGTGGDLGVMDEAIELLEKQRKVYYKRGGSGEIGEIRSRISEIDMRLSDLERKKSAMREEEAHLAEVAASLEELYRAKQQYEASQKQNERLRLKRSYEKQYLNMKRLVEEEKERLKAHELYFEAGIPTTEEINEAREKLHEGKRLFKEISSTTVSKELPQLREYFISAPEQAEITRAKEILSHLNEKNTEIKIADKELLSLGEVKSLNYTKSDADALIQSVKRSAKRASGAKRLIFSILGVLLGAVGAFLAIKTSPAFWALLIPAVVLVALGTLGNAKKDDSISRAMKLLTSLEMQPKSESASDILASLEAASRKIAESEGKILKTLEISEKKSVLSSEISLLSAEACQFIRHFPAESCEEPTASLERIFKNLEIYKILMESDKSVSKLNEEKLVEAERLIGEANAFLAKYKTSGQYPFDEISDALMNYRASERAVATSEKTLAEFALEHEINPDAISDEEEELTLTAPEDAILIEAKITELERERAISERQCRTYSDELELKEELEDEKERLTLLEKSFTEKLNTILKTKEYLTEAKDLLTSKYLEKTKTAFNEFIKLIGDENGEDFTMDTSFAIMKNERGSLKPHEAYSKGTRDLYSLAARLALVESLYETERPFIILDDPFAYFDDTRLKSALNAITALAKEKQIIYLTCSESRSI